ncbi:MAG: efflux RND transporter periplasmic adaptor subunit [Planctomycetes bacterium]|jgi:membrane fusion protein (multidrug efflux system)|nr:efflux RND transporter periplasmic adaptor subunit [Planctomycetota bacterium]
MIVREEKSKQEAAQRQPHPLKWWIPALVFFGGLVALAVLVVVLMPPETTPGVSTPPPINVYVEEVATIPEVEDYFEINGVVEPHRDVGVAAEVAGRIESHGTADKPLKEGDYVQPGDVILRINTDLLQAEFNRYDAQRRFDAAELERTIELNRRQVATAREVDEARTRWQISQAAYETAQAQLDRSIVKSPIPGVLNDLPVEVGEYVQPGDVVANIVQDDPVKVVVHVPERNIRYLSVGDQHMIMDKLTGPVLSQNGGSEPPEKWRGTITFISATADAATNTTRVELTVPNPRDGENRRLRSGQIVLTRLTRQVLKDVIMVPLRVLIPQPSNGGQQYVVFVNVDGVAEQRIVVPGQIRGNMVTIVGGDLKPGEKLIIEGHRYVGPGQALREVSMQEAMQ